METALAHQAEAPRPPRRFERLTYSQVLDRISCAESAQYDASCEEVWFEAADELTALHAELEARR